MNHTNIIIAASVAAVFSVARGTGVAAASIEPVRQPSTLPFGYPAFDKIKNEDYAPAFEEGMRQQAPKSTPSPTTKAGHLRQHHRGDGKRRPAAEPRIDRVLQPVRRQHQRHLQGAGARAGRSWRRTATPSA
jgi:hypothetical protein